MIEIVWEIVVKQDSQGKFELVYGPGGAWSKLFGSAQGFRGTTMLNDANNPRHYLILAVWDAEAHYEQALRDHVDEYAKLNADLEDWTESRTLLGVFRMRAEAGVRPRPKNRRTL